MNGLLLEHRTFRPFLLPEDLATKLRRSRDLSHCQVSHHNTGTPDDFEALLLLDESLRPIVLKRQGQDFASVATTWELSHSAILNPRGAKPIVESGGVVVGYIVQDENASYCSKILDINGVTVGESWNEPALEPSIPFEIGLGVVSGAAAPKVASGVSTGARAAVAATSTGVRRGRALATLLRSRLARAPLHDIDKPIRYGEIHSSSPHFFGFIQSNHTGTRVIIDSQRTRTVISEIPVVLSSPHAGATKVRADALREAAEAALERGQPTLTLRITQANPASRDWAEKLNPLRELPRRNVRRAADGVTEIADCEYVFDASALLQHVN